MSSLLSTMLILLNIYPVSIIIFSYRETRKGLGSDPNPYMLLVMIDVDTSM